MLVEIVAGVLLGLSVLVVVLLLPQHRPHREAPRDRTTAGLVTTVTNPAATRPPSERRRPGSGAPGAGEDVLPVGAGMLPVDLWDVTAVVLVLGMTLTVPVVGGVVAALVIPFLVVVAPLLALRIIDDELTARRRREE